jgi:quinol monooxygenase YgiN
MKFSTSTHRRSFLLAVLGGTMAAACQTAERREEQANMYGLIGKMRATPGNRDALATILLEGLRHMPGNLSYIVANDPAEPDVLWITEVWSDSDAHLASLSLPSVQQAIARGRPLIAGMEQIAQTQPIGGQGL